MNRILSILAWIVPAGMAAVSVILGIPHFSSSGPVTAAILLKLILLVALFLFSVSALIVFVLFRIRRFRSRRAASAPDFDDLTLKNGADSLRAVLERLSRDLGILTGDENRLLSRIGQLLEKEDEERPAETDIRPMENDNVPENNKNSLLREISRSLRDAGSDEDLFDRAIKMAAAVSHSRRASVMTLNDSGDSLMLRAALGWTPDDNARDALYPLEEGLAGRVVREGKRMLVSDIKTETGQDNREQYRSSSFVILPFFSSGRVAGVLNLTEREESDMYEFDELEILNFLIDMLSLALSRF